ncbi:MAG: Uma2 family endonuclease [Methylomonas lenta]|nr:Uma2 family endonuclease [Methylomonas lenta]
MALNTAESYLSEADYLAGEQDGEIRHELIDGQAYAMTGASDYHNKLSGNFMFELMKSLRAKGAPCTVYVNDMKVKVKQNFYYPDVMVVCNPNDKVNNYYKTQATVIVEVLSPSTRRFDKTHKRQMYQTLESLQAYVLVDQERAEIEVFTRQSGWQAEYFYPGDSINFQSIDVAVAVEDIYYQVDNDDMLTFLQAKQAQA